MNEGGAQRYKPGRRKGWRGEKNPAGGKKATMPRGWVRKRQLIRDKEGKRRFLGEGSGRALPKMTGKGVGNSETGKHGRQGKKITWGPGKSSLRGRADDRTCVRRYVVLQRALRRKHVCLDVSS